MADISTFRAQLQERELLRPEPDHFSALWEHGDIWQQAFDQLVMAEKKSDAQFKLQIDAAGDFDARRDQLLQWASELRACELWYGQVLKRLHTYEQRWNINEQGQSSAPNELFVHQAQIEMRQLASCCQRQVVELEYLEQQRLSFGRIDEATWHAIWAEFMRALRKQSSRYQYWFGPDIHEWMYAERVSWLQRIQQLQRTTSTTWRWHHEADRVGLQADAAQVSTLLDTWRPPPVNSNPVLGMIGAGVVIALLLCLWSAENRQTASATPTGMAEQPTPQQKLVPAFVADQAALNQAGKELLKQGRCAEAITQFQAAFDADPQAHDAYEPLNNMAFCLYDQGQVAAAQSKWQQSLAIEPNSPDANAGLGMLLYTAGQTAEGISYYRTAMKLNAGYADETWLRNSALWSEHSISSSRDLRAAASQP